MKNASFATNYQTKQIKLNFCCHILIFANNLIIATEKQKQLQKIITEMEVGRFLYFDCNSLFDNLAVIVY